MDIAAGAGCRRLRCAHAPSCLLTPGRLQHGATGLQPGPHPGLLVDRQLRGPERRPVRRLRQDIDGFFAWHARKNCRSMPSACAMAIPGHPRQHRRSHLQPVHGVATGLPARHRSQRRAPGAPGGQPEPAQLHHLQRHQAKSNRTFADEWLDDGARGAAKNACWTKPLDRYESLYGDLSPAQIEAPAARAPAPQLRPATRTGRAHAPPDRLAQPP